MHMIKIWDRYPIIELWNQGVAASRIVEKLDLDVSVRQVQRVGEKYGDSSLRAKGRLAAGEWGSQFKDIVLQMMIDRGDNPKLCALCGKKSDKQMTIHHTRYAGATLADLVFACGSCQNKGE